MSYETDAANFLRGKSSMFDVIANMPMGIDHPI